MNASQIHLVQSSWAKVETISDAAAELFYLRLFDLDPSIRPLFKSNIAEQGVRLMQMIGGAVRSLGNPAALVPVLKSLGARHVGYGVNDGHYDTVAQALLWTLKEGLGDEFTDEVRDAWVEVYRVVATNMQAGAREVALQAA